MRAFIAAPQIDEPLHPRRAPAVGKEQRDLDVDVSLSTASLHWSLRGNRKPLGKLSSEVDQPGGAEVDALIDESNLQSR